MGTLLDIIRMLVLLSGAILAVGALRAIARDVRGRPGALDLGMLALALAGITLAVRGLL